MFRPRQTSLRRKHRPRLAEAKLQARVNPDALARNLLNWRKHLTTEQQRREVWSLLQNLGGDVVVRRAIDVISHSRSAEELEGVLRAANADLWHEVIPAVTQRLHREILKATRPAARGSAPLEMLAQAVLRLNAHVATADIRLLLKSARPKLRGIGAELVAGQHCKELLDACLPLCAERGEAHVFACEAVGLMGGSTHAAALWPRVLAARKQRQDLTFKQLLDVFGQLGAYDVLLPLRIWIEEDFQRPNCRAWEYGRVWSQLIAAKLAADACTKQEALQDLRWFLKTAGPDLDENFNGPAAEHGFFALAAQFVAIGERGEAEAMIKRYAPHALPPLRLFPELCLPGLSQLAPYAMLLERQLWLAALGNGLAAREVADTWLHQLRTGQRPLNFEAWRFLDRTLIEDVLRRALNDDAPGVVRQTLSLLAGTELAQNLHADIAALTRHPSNVVRWKARRVLRQRYAQHIKSDATPHWVLLDAAVLTGAQRNAPERRGRRKLQIPTGIVLSERQGHGYKLRLQGLAPAARRATIDALLKAPLSRALERRVPQGPALEERPDIRALHELAPPGNAIDERMVEMAQAMMNYWNDGDDALSLDEDGVALIATGLTADVRAMDEDDVMACGAFIGEVLRKKLGGHWTGFDDNYALEINDELIQPLKWARDAYETKDVVEATRILTTNYRDVLNRLEIQRGHALYHADPAGAVERTLRELLAAPATRPMTELLAETRVLSYRLDMGEWPAVLASISNLLDDPAGTRAVAALVVYAPVECFAPAWAHWGRRRREETGFVDALTDAMHAAAQRDDLEAMPNWTAQPQQSRLSFLNSLRKRMDADAWRKVLLVLLRQRAAAGDRNGVAWCLYSYKYEFPDCLDLVDRFCDMSVSARQTVLKSTLHCTRSERTLFRAVWAEGLRDPAMPVVIAALNAVSLHNAKSLRPLVEALASSGHEIVGEAAADLLKAWQL